MKRKEPPPEVVDNIAELIAEWDRLKAERESKKTADTEKGNMIGPGRARTEAGKATDELD